MEAPAEASKVGAVCTSLGRRIRRMMCCLLSLRLEDVDGQFCIFFQDSTYIGDVGYTGILRKTRIYLRYILLLCTSFLL